MTNPKTNKILHYLARYGLLTLGCLLLAFGDAAFVTPSGLVTGGVISIGVLVQRAVPNVEIIDYVTWGVQILMLLISFFWLGKSFTVRTLYATLLYPAFFSLFYRLKVVNGLSLGDAFYQAMISTSQEGASSTTILLLAAIFGGAFIGAGVAITYAAGGSTGGLDVLCAILAKHTPIKEGASSFLFDGTLILIGMIVTRDVTFCLIGIITAFIAAAVVEFGFVRQNGFVIADIVSKEYKRIQEYVHKEMDHASTVIEVVGGYSGEDKVMLRVAIRQRELHSFKDVIASIDPSAWVTFTSASMIKGEGFDPLVVEHRSPLSDIKTRIAKRKTKKK